MEQAIGKTMKRTGLFKDSSIRTRLLSVFLSTIFILSFLNILLAAMHFKIVGENQKITENMFEEYKLMDSVTKMTQLHYVLIKNVVNNESLRKYQGSQGEINSLLKTLDRSIVDKKSLVIYHGLRNIIRSISADCETSLQDAINGNAQQGLKIYISIIKKSIYVHENLVTLILNELDRTNALKEQLQKTHLFLAFAGALLFICITTGCVLFVIVFSKKLIGPLVRLSQLAEHIADGDLAGEVDHEILLRNDELGSLSGSFNRMMVNLRKNIADLKNTQAQLLQSEKMASIGQLAAGVAHEINNPLGFVINNIEILERYMNDYTKILSMMENLRKSVEEDNMEKAKAMITEITKFEHEINLSYIMNDTKSLLQHTQTGLGRVQKIVMDLRTFSREGSELMEVVQVENIIDSILDIVQNELKYKAELRKNYADTPLIKCSPQKIGQVFINLLINSAQAIEGKGVIEIKTYVQNDHVCIDFHDTGRGIKPEFIKRVFDPFFTTKPVGQGTGLGLSVSYEIVREHKGDIKVRSEFGKWTTFTVMLPVVS